MFKRTKPSRIFQDLVHQIETAILDDKLKAGDKLPPQRELMEMFETSQGTVREALRILEHKGLIDIKLGVSGGAMIKAPDTEQVSESLASLIRHQKVSLDELAEFREGVEGTVAFLAAERADKEDIRWLKELLSQAGELLKKGMSVWEESVEIDTRLHLAIAEIARNAVYLSVIRMVHYNIDNYYDLLPIKEYEVLKKNYDNLRDIVSAVERKDAAQAQVLAQSHVRRFHQHMGQGKDKKAVGINDQ